MITKNAQKPVKGRPADDEWEEWELRQKEVRVYYFLIPPDKKIIVVGEFKKGTKEQQKTIREFQKLKQEFKTAYTKGEVKILTA